MKTVCVPKARLDWTAGEGDIFASYSADTISEGGKIRAPFEHAGGLWTATGRRSGASDIKVECYRLLPPPQFTGAVKTYAECAAVPEEQRGLGFYHGLLVTHKTKKYVLIGPPCMFVPELEPQATGVQMQLFGGADNASIYRAV